MTIEGEILEVPPMFGTAKGNLLLEFMQVSKDLQEIVMTSTFRKNRVDDMIKFVSPKVGETSISQDVKENNFRNNQEHDDNAMGGDSGESEGGSEAGLFEDCED